MKLTYEDVYEKLDRFKRELAELRDDQSLVSCNEKFDVCNDFDFALDSLDSLILRFKDAEHTKLAESCLCDPPPS